MDKIGKAPQVIAKVTRGIGYTRIEAEAGERARRRVMEREAPAKRDK